jgi:hypothetical protein
VVDRYSDCRDHFPLLSRKRIPEASASRHGRVVEVPSQPSLIVRFQPSAPTPILAWPDVDFLVRLTLLALALDVVCLTM